jgi:hypothetical protein
MSNVNASLSASFLLTGALLAAATVAMAESGPQYRDLQSQAMGRT